MPSFALLVCVIASTAAAAPAEFRETEEFADAVAAVDRFAEQYGPANTLLVIDIDNTLMAMKGELGSDQWFEWQEYLLENEPDSPHLVAEDFDSLLEVQGLLFLLGGMRPTQPDLPELVRGVQSSGVPTLVLTSRGPAYKAATLRELSACGYEMASSVLATRGVPTDVFDPYDPSDYAAVGLTAEDADLYRLGSPRPCGFFQGVFMTSGQNKGAMMLTMLHHAVTRPKAIVFVDDHGRHVNRVYDAMVRHGVAVAAFHYKREDANVKRFRYSDKGEVSLRWRRLEGALREVFAQPEEGGATARPEGAEPVTPKPADPPAEPSPAVEAAIAP